MVPACLLLSQPLFFRQFELMVVTLIGYRGRGKSSIAGPLAARLGCRWVDADPAIEQRAGKSISEIFATDGEPAFRQLEREVIAGLLQEEELVLAAGGGAILDAGTRTAMRAAGPVVWLTAPVAELAQRIEGDQTTGDRRPQLTQTGGLAEIEQVLRQREPLYRECAHLECGTSGREIEAIVTEILAGLGPWLSGNQNS